MQHSKIKRRNQIIRRAVVLFIVAISIMIVGFIALNSLVAADTPQVSSSPVMNACGSTTCGQDNAPVTIEIYSDFQ